MKRVDFDKNGILNVSERVGHYGLFRKRTYQLLVDLNTGEAVFDLSHSGDETIRFERYGNLFVLKRKKERKHFNQTVTYISIFDTVDEKIICRDLIAEDSEKYPICFFDLTDEENDICHLVSLVDRKKALEAIKVSFKDTWPLQQLNGEYYYKGLTKDDKEVLFNVLRGVFGTEEFDSIDFDRNIIIIKDGNEKYFGTGTFEEGKINFEYKSEKHSYVYVDRDNPNFVYGFDGRMVRVYFNNGRAFEPKFTVEADGIRFLSKEIITKGCAPSDVYAYHFEIRQGHRYGIQEVIMDNKAVDSHTLVNPVFTGQIEKLQDKYSCCYKTRCIDKYGMIFNPYKKPFMVPPLYEYHEKLSDNGLYTFRKGEKIDIYDVQEGRLLVDRCKIISNDENAIVFERYGKYGILWNLRNSSTKVPKFELQYGYDNITAIGSNWYQTYRNGKEGLSYYGMEIVPPKFKSAKLHYYLQQPGNNQTPIGIDNVYIELETKKGTKQTFRYHGGDTVPNKKKTKVKSEKFNSIEYYSRLVVMKDDQYTYLVNYEGKLIDYIEGNATIEERIIQEKGVDIFAYNVNGVLLKIDFTDIEPVEKKEKLGSILTGTYGEVIFTASTEKGLDAAVEPIWFMGDDKFDQVLIDLYNENPTLRKYYPNLLKK